MGWIRPLLDKFSAVPRWVGLAVVAVLVLGGGGWWWFSRPAKVPPAPVAEAPAAPSPQEQALHQAQQKQSSVRSDERRMAAEASAKLQDAAAKVKLLSPLVSDPDVQVREQAVKQLGMVNHPDAKKALASALNDKDIFVAVYAAESLARQGDFSGKDLAVRMMKENDDQTIRLSALSTISLAKDVSLRPAIRKLMWSKDPLVQQAAREVLGAFDMAEKERTAQERMKKEAERKKQEAQKEFAVSMGYYRKRLKEPGFPGNHAVSLLNDIIKKHKAAGADVAEADGELMKQEKVRGEQKKKMPMTAVKPTSRVVSPTSAAPKKPPVKMTMTAVKPTTRVAAPTSSTVQETLPAK